VKGNGYTYKSETSATNCRLQCALDGRTTQSLQIVFSSTSYKHHHILHLVQAKMLQVDQKTVEDNPIKPNQT
jgi:hypothetical protein